MNNKKIIAIIAAAFIVYIFVYFVIGNPIVALHNNQLKQAITSIEDKKIITLNEVVPFDWDVVYTFEPYTSKEEIEKKIGFKSVSIRETVNEGMVQLLFVRGKTVAASVCGYMDDLGYAVYFNDSVVFDDNIEFSVEKNSDIVMLTRQQK